MQNAFQEQVDLKYQIYNSLFSRLPFKIVNKTGIYLPMFQKICEEGLNNKLNPEEIIHKFFSEHLADYNKQDCTSMLFNFIQFIERQVVLFDATETAAFSDVHNVLETGTFSELLSRAKTTQQESDFVDKINNFNLQLVLTAHPTQFYPSSVLVIIDQLSKALKKNQIDQIYQLLMQLAKTPFVKKQKPTPYQEAKSLLWYLRYIFYDAVSDIIQHISKELPEYNDQFTNQNLIKIGFWPGGDRDGNPYVTSKTTRNVALALKRGIFRKYHADLNRLRKKLTFKNIEDKLRKIEDLVYLGQFKHGKSYQSAHDLLKDLEDVKNTLVSEHQSLFIEDLESFMTKVKIFGIHFAELDIRQDSSLLETSIICLLNKYCPEQTKLYLSLQQESQIELLLKLKLKIDPNDFEDPLIQDLFQCFYDLAWIQKNNGVRASHRFIISHTTSALHVMQIYALAKMTAWPKQPPQLDIIPLFESIQDLENAPQVMGKLYENPVYRKHLESRNYHQTIMMGYSDGTKDGGYMSSNWSIYKAKQDLTQISREQNIKLAFFDGRGGPPARGGGNTHKSYTSLGNSIENLEIQLTIQGQTISSDFGSKVSARYNIEHLLGAGIINSVFQNTNNHINQEQYMLLDELSKTSQNVYHQLKTDKKFFDYLQAIGPLNYYADTNVASRPTSRNNSNNKQLNSLRAIPFVSSCSQIKQNIPAFYGLGSALQKLIDSNQEQNLQSLYKDCLFFKTLINNSIQALQKSCFKLTAYIEHDSEFKNIWKLIQSEYELTVKCIKKITKHPDLIVEKDQPLKSIQIRQNMILPLNIIQQYALQKIRKGTKNTETYKTMVIRSMYGIINATRNSA